MTTCALPATNLVVSPLCLGTAIYGKGIDARSAFALMDRFVELGGNFLDTANVYADWLPGEKGSSEKCIGRWMKDRGNREQVVVCTKGGHFDLEGEQRGRLAPEEIRDDIDESLLRLRTDHVDLYVLHRDDPIRPAAEIIGTLDGLRAEGKLLHYGCSNWRHQRIDEARSAAADAGCPAFVVNEIWFSLAVPDRASVSDASLVFMDSEETNYHEENQLPALAFSSQAGGFFGPKYGKAVESKPANDKVSGVLRIYGAAANCARKQRAEELSQMIGCSVNQVALAYLMHQRFPVIPIVGCRTEAQLEDSFGAAEIKLEPGHVAALQNN